MNKTKQYHQLVKNRKSFPFSPGLLNPSQIENGDFDKENHIGPWSLWQGDLNAKIIVIGQDWSDKKYYLENKGMDSDDNTTNKNLVDLFSTIGIDIGYPSAPITNFPIFFTNCILGIKNDGGMTGKVKMAWARKCNEIFLEPLIKIIQPEILITLGKVAYDSLAEVYGLKKYPLKKIINENPIYLLDGKKLFAMYHCGGLGTANRKLDLQKKDWQIIKKQYENISRHCT